MKHHIKKLLRESLLGGNKVSIFDSIPEDSRYDLLRGFFQAYPSLDNFVSAYKFANEKYYDVRNNNDFDYYDTIISLLDTLK